VQVLFYLLGYISNFWIKDRPRILNIIFYFSLSNYAILLGIVDYIKGNRMATWETTREAEKKEDSE